VTDECNLSTRVDQRCALLPRGEGREILRKSDPGEAETATTQRYVDFEKCAPGERAGAASAQTAYLILAAKDERR